MPDLVAHVDGSCLGSPGPSGIGVIISGFKDGPITVAKWIGHQDNNVAEYMALLEALQCAFSIAGGVGPFQSVTNGPTTGRPDGRHW